VNTHPSRLLLVLCAASAALAAGCKAPPKPMKFNKLLVEGNQKLAEAGKAFRKTVEPLGEGKPVKAGDVESAYQKMASTLESVKSDWEDMKAPINSSSGPGVVEKYQAFLEAEETKVLPNFQKIVTVVKDGQLAPAAKWAKIQGVFQAIDAEESKPLQTLREAQTAYAKEHNLELDRMFFGGGGGPRMGPPAGMAPPGMAGPEGGAGGNRGGPPMPGGGRRGGPPMMPGRGGPPG
jgi:hypothetical protein